MREKLRWLGHDLWIKDARLKKSVIFGQLSRTKRKAGRPHRLEDVERKYLIEMGILWEGVKREALNRLGWRRSVGIYACLRWSGVAVSC